MRSKHHLFLALFIAIIVTSCSNNKEKIIGKWVNNDVDPPPTTVTISISNDIISVHHQWRLEYHEHINSGTWLKKGEGSATHTHAQLEDHHMRVDGSYMEFSENFTSMTWKGHTYRKID